MNNFYTLLDSSINTHEATTDETNDHKERVLSSVKPLYDKYLDAYKKSYDKEKVKEEEKTGRNYKPFEIIYNRGQGQKSTKKEETETKKADEIQEPLWVKINKNDFDLLIQDIYNNLNNSNFKTAIDKKAYDLKNAEKFLAKIITQKISEKEAFKLYSDQTTPDITELENTKSKGKNKKYNISKVLKNLESVFTGAYLCYKDMPKETMLERAELKAKNRKQNCF